MSKPGPCFLSFLLLRPSFFLLFCTLSNAPESLSAGFLGREEKKRLVLGCKRMVETVACVALLVCGLPFALDGKVPNPLRSLHFDAI